MLFLIALLLELIRSGTFDKKKDKKTQERIDFVQQQAKRIPKGPNPYATGGRNYIKKEDWERERRNYAKIIKWFDEFGLEEWIQIQKIIKTKIVSGDKQFRYNFWLFWEFFGYVARRKEMGRPLTKNQKRILELGQILFGFKNEDYDDIVIGEPPGKKEPWKPSQYLPISSSWLIKASYNPRRKTMVVIMKRGKANYRFFNVPWTAFVAVVTLPNNAGTYWWKHFYWKYSVNVKKWRR